MNPDGERKDIERQKGTTLYCCSGFIGYGIVLMRTSLLMRLVLVFRC